MEDTKKTNEAAKPEELAERVELTDEELDQASGGLVFRAASGAWNIAAGKDGVAHGKAQAAVIDHGAIICEYGTKDY